MEYPMYMFRWAINAGVFHDLHLYQAPEGCKGAELPNNTGAKIKKKKQKSYEIKQPAKLALAGERNKTIRITCSPPKGEK